MRVNKAPVNKIIPFSCVDGPGNRTAVFLQGCNINCLYCHNPETINVCCACGKCIDACPTNALSIDNGLVKYDSAKCCHCDTCIKLCEHDSSPKIQNMTALETMQKIEEYLPFIDGITVSGGECTLRSEYICDLFELVQKRGKTTFVDTNGTLPIKNNKRLLDCMDKAMVDFKAAGCEEHVMLTGSENKHVIENIKTLADMDKLFEIRTVVVPGLLDNEKIVDMGSKLIAPYKNVRYKLIKFRPFGVREGNIKDTVITEDMMQHLSEVAKKNRVDDIVII